MLLGSWNVSVSQKGSNGAQGDGKGKNLPVPVYLRPLDEKDASMKVRGRSSALA